MAEQKKKDRAATLPLKFDPKSLVGSFFHANAARGWQGVVVAEPQPGLYLVELFSWLTGHPNGQKLIGAATMLAEDWTFYDSAEEMNAHYEANPRMFRGPEAGE